jgi:hypothetical protein
MSGVYCGHFRSSNCLPNCFARVASVARFAFAPSSLHSTILHNLSPLSRFRHEITAMQQPQEQQHRRTASDPSFDRETLHAHHVFSRKEAARRRPFLSHTHPHMAKLPESHPEHFPGVHPASPEAAWTLWGVLKTIRWPKTPGTATAVEPRVPSDTRVHWSVLAMEIIITAFVISFGVISFWKGTWTVRLFVCVFCYVCLRKCVRCKQSTTFL